MSDQGPDRPRLGLRGVPRPFRREVDRFLEDPASIRNATVVIIAITVIAIFLGSLVMWLFDQRDFPDYGTALWFMIQTITTVGYGDVTPVSVLGRSIAGIVMVIAIASVAVVTALITSTFVEAAQRRRFESAARDRLDQAARVAERLDEIAARLTSIERRLEHDLGAVEQRDGSASSPPAEPREPGG